MPEMRQSVFLRKTVTTMISFFLTASTKPFAVRIPSLCNVSLWGHRGVVTMNHVTREHQGQ